MLWRWRWRSSWADVGADQYTVQSLLSPSQHSPEFTPVDMKSACRKLQNVAVALWEILTDAASIFFWLFLCKEAGQAWLQDGWGGVWRSLLERSEHRAFQLYVVGSSVAILASYWIPVTLFTILVSNTSDWTTQSQRFIRLLTQALLCHRDTAKGTQRQH